MQRKSGGEKKKPSTLMTGLFRNTGDRKDIPKLNFYSSNYFKEGKPRQREESNFLSHLNIFNLARMIPQILEQRGGGLQ